MQLGTEKLVARGVWLWLMMLVALVIVAEPARGQPPLPVVPQAPEPKTARPVIPTPRLAPKDLAARRTGQPASLPLSDRPDVLAAPRVPTVSALPDSTMTPN